MKNMSMRVLFLTGMVLLIFMNPAHSKGDAELGFSWAHLSKPRIIKYVVCDKGFSDEDKKSIKNAIKAWDNSPLISIEVDETKQCDTNKNWGKCQKINLIDLGAVEGGYEAIVSVGGAAQGCTDSKKPKQRLNCDIRVNEKIKRYSGSGTPGSGEYDLQSILVHELGHCVGLKDNSTDRNAVMFGLTDGEVKRTPTSDEKALRDKILK